MIANNPLAHGSSNSCHPGNPLGPVLYVVKGSPQNVVAAILGPWERRRSWKSSGALLVKTVYNVPGTQLQFIARSVIAVLFRFEIDVFELLHETCAIPDMTPVPKLASQALLVPFIMVVFLVVHTAGRLLHWLGRTARNQARSSATDNGSSALYVKLASGFITTLLFMYQKIGTTTFIVLNCVPIDNVSYWKIVAMDVLGQWRRDEFFTVFKFEL